MVGGIILAMIAFYGFGDEGLGWFFGYAAVFGGPWLMWKEALDENKKK